MFIRIFVGEYIKQHQKHKSMKLNDILSENFQAAEWEAKGYQLPHYDIAAVAKKTHDEPTWVHFGAGNIFRAFPAAILNDALNTGKYDRGVIVAESFDYEIIDKAYRPYHNLSLLVSLQSNGTIEKKVIASITESLKADKQFGEDWARLVQIFQAPSLQMVTFTITEKGYSFNDADLARGLDAVFAMGKLTALLYERFKAGKLPVTLQSTDNCSHNGDHVKAGVKAYAERWIDVYPNRGKRGGAYSGGCYDSKPYILLNYSGTLDSVSTIAHEMGHSMHSWFSRHTQPAQYADYTLFVAEVASTVNENLLIEQLLQNENDPQTRLYLLNQYLENFKGTVYRQTMFAEFELEMGKLIESGEALTADALSEKYHALNKLYFGPDMVSDDEIALEWTRIPHFYYNYYVFQYATSFSAAVAIANRILREGESAVKDYKKFLSGGCSKEPVELLRDMGVDMRTPAPVNDALSLFGELIDELSALLG